MQSEIVVTHSYKVTTEKDILEVGFFTPRGEGRSVGYATLGKTTVAISRGVDGKVRIEIDDTSEEPVYVSINDLGVDVIEGDCGPEKPWNAKLLTSQE